MNAFAFATTPWNLLFCEALWIDAKWLQRMTELASWSLREILIRLLEAFQWQIPASAKKGVCRWREEIWDAVAGNGLYRQTHLPFWRAMVGCIALAHSPPPCIGLFFILHEPIMCNYNCVIEIGFSWRGNKSCSHTKHRYLDAVQVKYRKGNSMHVPGAVREMVRSTENNQSNANMHTNQKWHQGKHESYSKAGAVCSALYSTHECHTTIYLHSANSQNLDILGKI